MLVDKILSFLGFEPPSRAHQRANLRQPRIDTVRRISKQQAKKLLTEVDTRPDGVDYFRKAELDYLRRVVEAEEE